MPIVSNCVGLLNMNRLNIGQMLLVLLNQMAQKCSYSSAISIKGVAPDKCYSAGIMHMNKASRFHLEAVSERETACH